MLALEAALLGLAILIGGGRLERSLAALIFLTAPLEVYRTSVAGVNLSLFRISVGVALVYLLVRHARGWRRGDTLAPWSYWRRPLVVAYVAIAGWMVISVAFEPINTFLGLRVLGTVLIGVAALTSLAFLMREAPLAATVEMFAFAAVLPILASAWQGIAFGLGWDAALPFLDLLPVDEGLEKSRDTGQFFGSSGNRARGTFADANHFGAFVSLALIASVGLFVRAVLVRQRHAAVGFGALAVAAVTMLISSYSRSAWLGTGAATVLLAGLVLPLVRAPGGGRRMAVAAAGVAALVAVLAIPLAPLVLDRLDSDARDNRISNTSHSQTINAAVAALEERPLTGIGLGGLGIRLDQGPRTSGAHSSYLSVGAELGAVGLLLLLWAAALALTILIRATRTRFPQEERVLAAALLAGYVGFLVSNVVYDLWWDDFHWAVLAMVLACDVRTPA